MKWYGITGSWRRTNDVVEADVRASTQAIIGRGDGIVTGGALNVDWFATDEALRHDPTARQIKVCLPVSLNRYADHYRKRADEGIITHDQAEKLIVQLRTLKKTNPESLIENQSNRVVDQENYFERNTQVVNLSDEIIAFQVNGSQGVQDTIEKARKIGKPVSLKSYSL